MKSPNDLADRTLSIKKTLNASIKTVWEAWIKPEHLANWWGPMGMQVNIIEHNFKIGGKWKYNMLMPGKGEFISEGEYIEIVEFKKIITTANFKPMTEGVELQAIFEENGDKTNFTFNVVHPTVEYCQQQEKMGFYNGWGSVFSRLNEFLQSK